MEEALALLSMQRLLLVPITLVAAEVVARKTTLPPIAGLVVPV